MSQPIDVVFYTAGGGERKLGEITINDDNTLEGFLFEGQDPTETFKTLPPGDAIFMICVRPSVPVSEAPQAIAPAFYGI